MRLTAQRFKYIALLHKSQYKKHFSVIFLTVSRNNSQKYMKQAKYFVAQAQIIEADLQKYTEILSVRGFQFPRRLSHPDKRRSRYALLCRTARRAEVGQSPTSGGGEAAAYAAPPLRAGRRAARQARFNVVCRSTVSKFLPKWGFAAFRRTFREARHRESRSGRRRRGEATDKSPREAFAQKTQFPAEKQPLCYFGDLCHACGFQLALPSRSFLNAAIRTSSVVSTLRGAPHSACAECGWRRLSPPPHARSPLRGLRGAALRHRYISFCGSRQIGEVRARFQPP